MSEDIQKLISDRDRLLDVVNFCADALAYAAYNIDGSKLCDLPEGLIDSTGSAETALIAERMARNIIVDIKWSK